MRIYRIHTYEQHTHLMDIKTQRDGETFPPEILPRRSLLTTYSPCFRKCESDVPTMACTSIPRSWIQHFGRLNSKHKHVVAHTKILIVVRCHIIICCHLHLSRQIPVSSQSSIVGVAVQQPISGSKFMPCWHRDTIAWNWIRREPR